MSTSSPPPTICAAACLNGLKLTNGWQVLGPITRSAAATGGVFSYSYKVSHVDGRQGFLKALDFSRAFDPGVDTIRSLSYLTSAYEHEREVLRICSQKRLSNVVVALDSGEVQVPAFDRMTGRVFYLIFELADGDIRSQVSLIDRLGELWSLQALKDVCLGLWQVHKEMIAHQDMKPSNVLLFEEKGFQIADFGRSSVRGKAIAHDDLDVAGDRTYSPLELLYGYKHSDFNTRRFGCDLYMLGNLAAFMFAGSNVTASVLARLDKQFQPRVWSGSYEQVLPYLQHAFSAFIFDLSVNLVGPTRELAISLIRQLCNPDLSLRGHPKGLKKYDQYSLERYVSKLDLAYRRAALELRVGKAAK